MMRLQEAGREHIVMDELVAPLMERASLYVAPRAFVLGWHGYPVFEVHYLHRGILTWEMEDGSRLRIRGGDVAVVQPDVRHHSLHNAEMPSVTLSFAVLPDAPAPTPPFGAKEEQEDAFRILRAGGNRVVRGSAELGAAFRASRGRAEAMVAVDETPRRRDLTLLRNLLHRCFLLMVHALGTAAPRANYAPVQRAVRFIQMHVLDDLSAEAIARAAGVSKRRLYQLFHLEMGEDIHRFHARLRLERAMGMLANSNVAIAAVADRLGFSSGAALSRSFRKHFGTTPSAWRQETRAERNGRITGGGRMAKGATVGSRAT